MKRVCLAIWVMISAIGMAASQSVDKPAELPPLETILERYIAALGGKVAIAKLTSFQGTGTFEFPAASTSGRAEVFARAPNKLMTVMTIPGFGKVTEAFDGRTGWSMDPKTGLRELSGGELAEIRRDAVFYKQIRLKELYPRMTVRGIERAGERDAYAIDAVPVEGAPERLYFDIDSGLLIKNDVIIETDEGKIPFQVYFEDYRNVGGVKMPFRIRRVNPALGYNLTLSEIRRDVVIADARFSKPQPAAR